MTEMKTFFASVQPDDANLGPREIRVVANSGKADRVKDVLSAKGAKLDNYRKNPIVLADHDRKSPIGNFAPEVDGDALSGVLTFAPAGISAKADEYCGLYKAGVMSTVSVGFNPIDYEPNKAGGYDFKEWELLELSCVAVPCDPDAVVTGRALDPGATKGEGAAWKVGASRNLPVGGDEAWDGPAAEASIFEHAGFDGDSPDVGFARKGFLAYDSVNPKLKGSYKLPFARIVDGRLTAMPSGIRAAASRLPGTDISDEARVKARAVIDHYEAKMKPNDDDKAVTIAELKATIAGLSQKSLSAEATEHAKALRRGVAALGACRTKALDSHGQTHDDLETLRDHLNEFGHHAKALADSLKPGAPVSDAHVAHGAALQKCLSKALDAHQSAMDGHDETEENVKALGPHLDEASGHVKALLKGRKRTKPSDDTVTGGGAADPNDGDDEDPNDDGSDVELATEAARRKRLIEIAARA